MQLRPVYLPKSGVGALAYTFIGDQRGEFKPLSRLFDEAVRKDSPRADDSLNRARELLRTTVTEMFETYLDTWYRHGQAYENRHLFKTCFSLDRRQLSDLRSLTADLSHGRRGEPPFGELHEIVNKWDWWTGKEPFVFTHHVVVHGDLHANNVVLNATTRQLFLIDYGLTGLGHFLKDFVKLETDLKFRFIRSLITSEEQLAAVEKLLELEDELITSETNREPNVERLGIVPDWFFRVLQAIRLQALRRMGSRRWAEYGVGLAKYALRMALYEGGDIERQDRLSMLSLGEGYLSRLRLDSHTILWDGPERPAPRISDGSCSVIPRPGPKYPSTSNAFVLPESGSLQYLLGRLGIGSSGELGDLSTNELRLLGDPELIVGNVFWDGKVGTGFAGIGPGDLLVDLDPLSPPGVPGYVTKAQMELKIASTEKNRNKVFLDRLVSPILDKVDEGNKFTLVTCRSDWFMREAIKSYTDRIRDDILSGRTGLAELSLPLDVDAVLITSDGKLVLGYRTKDVEYHRAI